MGCAIGEFGKANVTPFDITVPSGVVGQNKSAIMKTLGNPDYVLTEAGTEYWGYRNHNGWCWALYVIIGMTDSKDLIVEFQKDKAQTAYLVDKGTSIGIFMPPLAVAH
jgi:hypothetical protein